MRLIDADAFDKILIDGELTARREKKYVFESAINTIRGNLKNMPTIEKRKTGEWIRKISVVDCATFVGDECSRCGYFKSMGQANFCPNCGADMRGGEPHETP